MKNERFGIPEFCRCKFVYYFSGGILRPGGHQSMHNYCSTERTASGRWEVFVFTALVKEVRCNVEPRTSKPAPIDRLKREIRHYYLYVRERWFTLSLVEIRIILRESNNNNNHFWKHHSLYIVLFWLCQFYHYLRIVINIITAVVNKKPIRSIGFYYIISSPVSAIHLGGNSFI